VALEALHGALGTTLTEREKLLGALQVQCQPLPSAPTRVLTPESLATHGKPWSRDHIAPPPTALKLHHVQSCPPRRPWAQSGATVVEDGFSAQKRRGREHVCYRYLYSRGCRVNGEQLTGTHPPQRAVLQKFLTLRPLPHTHTTMSAVRATMIVRPAVAFRASASAPARAIAKVRGLIRCPSAIHCADGMSIDTFEGSITCPPPSTQPSPQPLCQPLSCHARPQRLCEPIGGGIRPGTNPSLTCQRPSRARQFARGTTPGARK
jgi:hypothetical protein